MKKEENPLRLLIIFVFAVLMLAAFSLAYKVFVQIKESRYNSVTYNLLVVDRDAHLLHIDTDEKRIVRIKYPYAREDFINRSKVAASVLSGVPLDAVIISNDQLGFPDGEITFKTIAGTIFSSRKYRMWDVNAYDLLKVSVAASGIDARDIKSMEIKLPEKQEDMVRQADIPEDGDFRDRDIFNEKVSVAVVNATGINGVGGYVSELLARGGFNVVATETGEAEESGIEIRREDVQGTATLRRLMNIFQADSVGLNESLIADVSIIIGEDLASQLVDE